MLESDLKVLIDGVDELTGVVSEAETGVVSEPASNAVIELVALRAVSLLESYLEALFYHSILGNHPSTTVQARLPVKDRAEADLLIFSSGRQRENYLTWLPFDVTLARADSYLVEGHPFSWLRNRPDEKKALQELSTVRNAVAHPGMYAFTQLEKLAESKGYNVQRPADYLRSVRSGSTEILLLLTQVNLIAKALAQATEINADAMLQPEALFQVGQSAPQGRYECRRCEESVIFASPAKLLKCSACSAPKKCDACGHVKETGTMWVRHLS